MSNTYSTKDAAELTGASRQALRAYTKRYARYFSTEATPAEGTDRRFTVDDLRLVAFIYSKTSAGASHEQVLNMLSSGALDDFEWQPPAPAESHSAPEAPLVPIERLQAAHALLQDAQRREREAIERAEALQREKEALTLELGQAKGEAATLKAGRYRAPAWFRAIFGGAGE